MVNNNGSASIFQTGLFVLALTNSIFQGDNMDSMEPTRSFDYKRPLCPDVYQSGMKTEGTNKTEKNSLDLEDVEKTIVSFAQKLIKNSVIMPIEYEKVFNDNFWDLV